MSLTFHSSGSCSMRSVDPSPAGREIAEIRAVHFVGPIDVAQMDDHRLRHDILEPLQIEGAELFPFGRDDDGALGCAIGDVAIGHRGKQRLCLLHASAIVAAHGGTQIKQRRDQGNVASSSANSIRPVLRRACAHVVIGGKPARHFRHPHRYRSGRSETGQRGSQNSFIFAWMS